MNLNSPEYPDLLKHIHNPPKQLYWKGDISILQEKICISFVGSRNFTPYGREVVEKLVCDLSLCDVVIVSGLARGIDSIAHEAALRHGLKTVAVLGTGIDIVYPEENVSLADRIVRGGGCVLSEYPGDTPVRDFQFPMRNRIIAGLSLGTVVIEAPEKSGALITAKRANEENREVFAVPGDIDRDKSVGCNKLLQTMEAKPVLSGMDIVRELSLQPSLGLVGGDILPKKALQVLEAIPKTKPIDTEKLAKNTGLDLSDIIKYLSLLEIHLLIYSTNSGFYLRK